MKLPTLHDYVLDHVDPDNYYAARFADVGWTPTRRAHVRCVWHDEKTGSLSLSLDNGGAKCWGCGKSFGNIIHFEAKLKCVDETEAAKLIYAEFIRPCIESKSVKRYIANLQTSPGYQSGVCRDLGFIYKTIKEFKLGLNTEKARITIPVYDQFGNCTNIRYYRLPSLRKDTDTAPKIFNEKGFGYLELYPWPLVRTFTPEKPLLWLKAERDVILAIQDGFQAVCTTGAGESASVEEWVELFADFQKYIIGDQDETGWKQAAKKLQTFGDSAKLIQLPTEEKDYSDWRLKDNGNPSDLIAILKEKKSVTIPLAKTKVATSQEKVFASLQEIKNNSSLHNRQVNTRGIIVGVLDKSYAIPHTFWVSSKHIPKKKFTVEIPSRELIWMIRQSDDEILDFIRKRFFPRQQITLEVCETVSATEIEVCPLVDFNENQQVHGGYTIFPSVYVGEKLQTNTPYEMEIYPTTSIHTQQEVGIITNLKATTSALDTTKFSEEEIDQLCTLTNNEKDIDAFWEEFCNFANEISLHYTRIYNRLDWHLVALLTWLSPLRFDYPNEGRQRGWINSLVVGDTQTGKSQVVYALQQLFNCGNVISAENCTFVGLVGGTVKNSTGQFVLRWGRIPVNDRQLVAIEELSGLSTAEISRMSDIRSSGVARIDKAGITAETFARTRLLALSNVRGMGKALSAYPSGVRAVMELIGQAEDVSRFDLISTLTDEEVNSRVINQKGHDFSETGMYHTDTLRLLVRFIWCLKPEQIDFTQEAYFASLQRTQELAKEYHPSVPIFKAGSGRLKLARIACAIACAQFNWNRDKEQIQVTGIHVQAAERLLRMLYDKESFGYKRVSSKAFNRETLKNVDEVEKTFKTILRKSHIQHRILDMLTESDGIDDRYLASIGNLSPYDSRRLLGSLVDSNALEKAGKDYWRLTKVGREWVDNYKKTC